MSRNLVADLFCGLGGWAEGFLAEGWEVVGFDNVFHDYGTGTYPGTFVLQDIRTLHGSRLKDASVIVASPPCTEYSYMAMPWKRAKQIARALRGKDEFPYGYKGSRSIEQLNLLFNECFRLQREASKAAGRYIPLIVENVKGAQPWVGRAPWNFGSFYLWGDVPALMPMIVKRKISGQNWSRYARTGEVSPHWRMEGIKVPSPCGRRTDVGKGARFTSRDCGIERNIEPDRGVKGFTPHGQPFGKNEAARRWGSKSRARARARARASAEIAKIPFPLAQHIARVFKDVAEEPNQ